MKIYYYIILAFLLSSCFRNPSSNAVGKLSKAELERRKEDSIQRAELDYKIFLLKEQLRIDSTRIADSIAALPPPIDYDTVLIASLQRTPCYGKCPHYEIRLFASGYAQFFGFSHVDRIGKFEYRYDSLFVKNILEKAELAAYFSFEDFYPDTGAQISDFPMCISSVTRNRQRKIIYNRNDAPIDLIKFENFLDGLFFETDWKPIGSDKNPSKGKGLLPDNR
jgi:hypothetical protein